MGQYLHRGQVLKTREDHMAGQKRLELWLLNANSTLTATNPCTVESLNLYIDQLKVRNVNSVYLSMIEKLAYRITVYIMN